MTTSTTMRARPNARTRTQRTQISRSVFVKRRLAAAPSDLLSAEEERTLAHALRSPDRATAEAARTRLVEANTRLVASVASYYTRFDGARGDVVGNELEDLIQEGHIGLLRAIEVFDPARGNRFSTVAVQWIRQSISRALADRGSAIRVPAYMHQRIRTAQRERALFEARTGQPPTLAQLARAVNLSEAETREALFYAQRIQPPRSLDQPITSTRALGPSFDMDILTLAGALANPEAERAIDEVEDAAAADSIHNCIARLKAQGRTPAGRDLVREMEALERRYLDGQTLVEIGAALGGISHERVRQIILDAVHDIRQERRKIQQQTRNTRERQARQTQQQQGGAA